MKGRKQLIFTATTAVVGFILVAFALGQNLDALHWVALICGMAFLGCAAIGGQRIARWVMNNEVMNPKWLPPKFRPTPKELTEARQFTRKTFGSRWNEVNQIAGWLHPDQGTMLCYLAKVCPPGPIVEIGSFRGKSTVFLGRGMKPNNVLTAIDPHILSSGGRDAGLRNSWRGNGHAKPNGDTSWEGFNQTLADWDLADRVNVVRDFSYALRPKWNEPISLLWIDGDHSYGAVKRDIDDWADLVKPGGFIAFHDTHPRHAGNGAVRRAINDTGLLTKKGFKSYVELRHAWFLQKA